MNDWKDMDEQIRLRQFYLRVLLALGIVWGCQLFVTAPFIFRGQNDTTLEIVVAVINALTIMPACIWLTANALGMALVIALFINRLHPVSISVAIGLLVPVFIAVALNFIELTRWPGALNSSNLD